MAKSTYPEQSEAEDNLFGELRAAEGEFKRENAFLSIEKVAKKEQSKFVGLKKEDEATFEINKIFNDDQLVAQLMGQSPEEIKDLKGTYVFKMNTISRTEPSALNQELYDRVFGKDLVTNDEEFIAKIRETIGENYKRESDHFLEHHIEDYFISNTPINLPGRLSCNLAEILRSGRSDRRRAWKRNLKIISAGLSGIW